MRRILLAEDDADDRDIFIEVVRDIDKSIEVTAVENGQLLIDLLRSLNGDSLPELILLDQNMPVLKGKDTLQVLRGMERFRTLPMVIYTTYHDNKFFNECVQQDIDLLLKPNTYKELKMLIAQLIEKYSPIDKVV